VGLGVLFLAHGYIKIHQPTSWSTEISRPMQHLVGWTEFTCGLALALGLFSRLAAFGVAIVMIGAISLITGQREFIDISIGRQGFNYKVSGYEYNFIILTMSLAVIALGSGRFSLDHLIFGRKDEMKARPQATGAPHLEPDPIVTSAPELAKPQAEQARG
jgi:putative oxidoreductase